MTSFEDVMKNLDVAGDDDKARDMAQKMWSYLDHLSATDPKAYQQFVQQQMDEQKKYNADAYPPASFTLRCKNSKQGGAECLVSFCTHEKVPYPETQTSPVPAATSDPFTVTYKGVEIELIEVVFNPRVMSECEKDTESMELLKSLALKSINQKHAGTFHLSIADTRRLTKPFQRAPTLPDLQEIREETERRQHEVSAEMEEARVKSTDDLLTKLRQREQDADTVDPAITLLTGAKKPQQDHNAQSDSRPASPPLVQKPLVEVVSSSTKEDITVPTHTLEMQYADGASDGAGTPNALLLTVMLPGISSAAEIDLDVDEDSLTIDVIDSYHLEQPLPFSVDPDGARAQFLKQRSALLVTLPRLFS